MRGARAIVMVAAVVGMLGACDSGGGEPAGPDVLGVDVASGRDVAPDVGGGGDALGGEDVVGPVDTGTPPDPPDPDETRLDPICVGELCAAGPDNAPDPAEYGPFPVGARTFVLVDEAHPNSDGTPRTLRTEVWYPATDEFGDGPFETYSLATDSPESLRELLSDPRLGTLPTRAVRDADPRTADGPYPLVLFSHGAYGVRFQSTYFTVQLASHGYVVIAPDHQGNTTWDILETGYDMGAVGMSASQRILDAPFLIDQFLAMNEDAESPYHGLIAKNRIGVTGHSFGGYVSLVMGGRDERISVIVPMAPAGRVASVIPTTNVPGYRIPILMMGGDMDKTLEFEPDMLNIWQQMPAHKAFLRFFRGGHYTFTEMCALDLMYIVEELHWVDAEDALEDGCGPENFDPDVAHRYINHYAIAMMNAHLRLSPASFDYLDAAHVSDVSEDVEFLREGLGPAE